MPERRLFPIGDLIADYDTREVAKAVHVSPRTVQRWIVKGVDWRAADAIAARVLNTHPICVFGPEWHAAAEAASDKDDHHLQFNR